MTFGYEYTKQPRFETVSSIDVFERPGHQFVGETNILKEILYVKDGETWIGFDADMARIVAEKLDVEIEFVVIDWDTKAMELDSKKIDVVWNGMTITDEVKAAMDCTNAYCNNAQVVVVAK